jgi:hypothetical protein
MWSANAYGFHAHPTRQAKSKAAGCPNNISRNAAQEVEDAVRQGPHRVFIMAKKIKQRTFDEATAYFRDHGFELLEAPGTNGRIFLKKLNVSAAVEKTPEGLVRIFAYPGYLVSGEISKLVDRGYQKFLKTSKNEIAATADHLHALHTFSEELKEALGTTSLYNESLGSVSESYHYDRVKDRDQAEAARPKRPWQKKAASKKPA